MRQITITLVLTMTFLTNIRAQDIENVIKADSVSKAYLNKVLTSPLELNGQLNARTLFYAGTGKYDPFTYLLNGSVNIQFMEYSMPLSFTYTNKGLKYAASSPLKFNRFKLSPHYKWIRLHIGSTSLSYSPYTLGGAQFRGVGVEFTPEGAFSGSAMYGRFYDAVEYDPANPYVQPVFKRSGYALQMAYQKEKIKMEASFLNASDDPNSIVLPADSIIQMHALQNVSMSFKSRFTPIQKVNLDVEYASSHVNYSNLLNRQDFWNMLVASNANISRFKAYKLNLNFNPGAFTFGGSIEHIDPDFITLGAYYSRNDFQNITANIGGNIFNSKVNFMVNGGLENDNLKNQKQRKSTRSVGAAALNYMPTDKFSASLNYSNFQSFSNIKNQFDYINEVTPFDNIDTLNYQQVNQNASANILYRIKATEQNVQVVKLLCNLNQTSDAQGNIPNAGSTIMNLNGMWSSSYPQSKSNVAAGVNSTFLTTAENNTATWGPVVSGTCSMLNEELKLNLSLAYNQSLFNNQFNRSNFNIRGAAEYTLKEMHKFRLEYTVLLKRNNEKEPQNDYRLTLSYTLALKKKEIYLNKAAAVKASAATAKSAKSDLDNGRKNASKSSSKEAVSKSGTKTGTDINDHLETSPLKSDSTLISPVTDSIKVVIPVINSTTDSSAVGYPLINSTIHTTGTVDPLEGLEPGSESVPETDSLKTGNLRTTSTSTNTGKSKTTPASSNSETEQHNINDLIMTKDDN